MRTDNFGTLEAQWVTASWFGPMENQTGYLAPVLKGIWASAPYFHNGSIPTLEAVLDSSLRPLAWMRTGSDTDDYDVDAVGWKFTEESATGVLGDTIEKRKTFDTLRPGLSKDGHTFGDALTTQQRSDLLQYLKSL